MIVAAISAFVTQFGFDLSQPLLCGFTHAALVHAGQEHLLQLVSKRADAGQHNIDLPVPLSEHGFRLAAGFFRRPLIRPLRKSLRQLEPFVNTVCVADHQTPMAAELAQHQSQIRYWDIPCPPRLPTMIHIKPMAELRAGVLLMIAVDAEKGTSSLNWFFCSRSQEPPQMLRPVSSRIMNVLPAVTFLWRQNSEIRSNWPRYLRSDKQYPPGRMTFPCSTLVYHINTAAST